jgi:hypothetical protein
MEESLQLLNEGSRTSLDLLREALKAVGNDSVVNAQTRMQDLWEASLQAMRNNAHAVSQANAKVVESWMPLFSEQPNASTKKKAT